PRRDLLASSDSSEAAVQLVVQVRGGRILAPLPHSSHSPRNTKSEREIVDRALRRLDDRQHELESARKKLKEEEEEHQGDQRPAENATGASGIQRPQEPFACTGTAAASSTSIGIS
ncbi:unnamed protein product, partial [Amoebophrya sp. A25]